MASFDVPSDFERRPLVFVEDHLYHTVEVLAALAGARPDLVEQVTICAVDRAGPDTSASVHECLRRHPRLQVAAMVDDGERLLTLAAADLADAASVARLLVRLLRPGGIFIQDVQLSTLGFLPADRWWESIYVAAMVRGMFATRPPQIRFLSNKRGYSATFGRDLIEAGFDPRDVMDKADLAAVVIPTIATLADRAFPLELTRVGPGATTRSWRVADHPDERRDVEAAIDLVLWPSAEDLALGGCLMRDDATDRRVTFQAGSQEARTWRALVDDRLAGGLGLPVLEVGRRLASPGAERAELTNLAARHIHTLRNRLSDPTAIVTINHAYRLGERLRVGIAATVNRQ